MSKLWRESMPIDMELMGDQPAAFTLNHQYHLIDSVENRWRADQQWRDGPTRDYFLVVTHRGMWGIIFQDLIKGEWFMQAVID